MVSAFSPVAWEGESRADEGYADEDGAHFFGNSIRR